MGLLPVSGVILAGGRNLRFGGRNKALVKIGGRAILDRTLAVLNSLFQETMVVTNAPQEYLSRNALIVTDIFKARSPLAGIHAALTFARSPHIFVAACDTPFISLAMIETILKEIDTKSDIVVPETEKGYQPLFAVYSKQCLPVIEKQLRDAVGIDPAESAEKPKRILYQELKILNVFDKVRVKAIPEQALREVDQDLISFFNINTPEDFALAERLHLKHIESAEAAL